MGAASHRSQAAAQKPAAGTSSAAAARKIRPANAPSTCCRSLLMNIADGAHDLLRPDGGADFRGCLRCDVRPTGRSREIAAGNVFRFYSRCFQKPQEINQPSTGLPFLAWVLGFHSGLSLPKVASLQMGGLVRSSVEASRGLRATGPLGRLVKPRRIGRSTALSLAGRGSGLFSCR